MFGMGFMEILLIAVIAIIALGPEKLPTAMVEIAKFLKKFKSGIEDAKSTLDNELNISEMKAEAAKYKAQIEDAKSTLNLKESIDLELNNITNDDTKNDDIKEELDIKTKTSEKENTKEKVSLKEPKKKKKKKEEKKAEEKIEEAKIIDNSDDNAINKFRVDFDELEENK